MKNTEQTNMYYNHPIHGDPDSEEVQEFREYLRQSRWECPKCGRIHPSWHTSCWYCYLTKNFDIKKESQNGVSSLS